MVALVIESAVGDYDVGGMGFGLLAFLLLRPHHNQGKLSGGLPYIFFLQYLFSVGWVGLGALVVAGVGTLFVVDFVAGVMCSVGVGLLLFLLMDDACSSHNIEAGLRFGDDFSVLVFLKTDIFVLEILLSGFVALVD